MQCFRSFYLSLLLHLDPQERRDSIKTADQHTIYLQNADSSSIIHSIYFFRASKQACISQAVGHMIMHINTINITLHESGHIRHHHCKE